METLEWRDVSIDRTDWDAGPWDDEPDKAQWPDPETGLPCLMHRGPLGALCGYVGVPPGHPWHGVLYSEMEVDIDVHGGLTFTAGCQKTERPEEGVCHIPGPGEPDDVWWLGFDCAHAWDVIPHMRAIEKKMGLEPLNFDRQDSYKDFAYVKAQCARLAQQVAAVL